ALLSAASDIGDTEDGRIRLEGEIPSAAAPPGGCAFHTRCPRRIGSICDEVDPPLNEAKSGHAIRCHIPADELTALQVRRPSAPSSEASRQRSYDKGRP